MPNQIRDVWLSYDGNVIRGTFVIDGDVIAVTYRGRTQREQLPGDVKYSTPIARQILREMIEKERRQERAD